MDTLPDDVAPLDRLPERLADRLPERLAERLPDRLPERLAERLAERREGVAAAFGLDREIVLVGAGPQLPVPGSGDQLFAFRPHPEFVWLAGDAAPDEVLAFDPGEGWTRFAPLVTPDDRVWTGAAPRAGEPLDRLDAWLAARAGRRLVCLGVPVREGGDPERAAHLRETLRALRRPKDEWELERMRAAARATARGFARLANLVRPGVTERELQVELEAEFFRAGAAHTAYETIVASGPRSAVLHSAPGPHVIREGELVLVDAGAEMADGYCADVTRTFAADGTFGPEQQALYDVVNGTRAAAIARCRAGRGFRDLHLEACVELARGLVDFGVLRGDPEGLVERDAHALFFPHGLGHMVGLGVRDGDSAPDRLRSERPGLRFLRLDDTLRPGYTLTIEPGIYFIPALLDPPATREAHADCVDWERVDALRGFGGIRLEDNVHVTGGGPEVLTEACGFAP